MIYNIKHRRVYNINILIYIRIGSYNYFDYFAQHIKMGGAATREVVCTDFDSAFQIEVAIDYYIDQGMRIVNEELGTWLWFPVLFPFLFSKWMQDYIFRINEIVLCGISNGVETKYNEDWKKYTFVPAVVEMEHNIFELLDTVWHPAVTIGFLFYPTGPVGPIINFSLFVFGIVSLGKWYPWLNEVYDSWQGKGDGGACGECVESGKKFCALYFLIP